MRGFSLVYLVLLTYALLSPDPLAWFRTKSAAVKKPLPPYLAWLMNDKFQHAAAYAVLAMSLRSATGWSSPLIHVLCSVHGGAMEILQQFSPPRTMDVNDWLADMAGALIGLAVYRLLPWRRLD